MLYKMAMRIFAKVGSSLLVLCLPLLVASGSAGGEYLVTDHILLQGAAPQSISATGTQPVLLTPAELETLLPSTVYFRGKTASIQLRNAAGVRFGPDRYFLAALVDTSGYASNLQESYQMYLITESAVTIAGQHLGPGAYGAGVVNGRFIVMDIGGHTLLQVSATVDERMPRPRPLQMLTGSAGEVKLYIGRDWITIAETDLP